MFCFKRVNSHITIVTNMVEIFPSSSKKIRNVLKQLGLQQRIKIGFFVFFLMFQDLLLVGQSAEVSAEA